MLQQSNKNPFLPGVGQQSPSFGGQFGFAVHLGGGGTASTGIPAWWNSHAPQPAEANVTNPEKHATAETARIVYKRMTIRRQH